jgi:hypothetical protein
MIVYGIHSIRALRADGGQDDYKRHECNKHLIDS